MTLVLYLHLQIVLVRCLCTVLLCYYDRCWSLYRLVLFCVLNELIRLLQEVYEQQKELILIGEKIVLSTLGFDFNVNHPYKPLVEAIKKFKVAQNALAQVAWNFVNDGYVKSLFTSKDSVRSMCLVFSSSYNEKMLAVCGRHSACNLSLTTLRRVQFFLLLSSLK